MKHTLRLIIALLVLFACVGLSYGWNDTGHMAVAFIAYRSLTPATRVRVDRLIQLNPRYKLWVKMLPPGISEGTKRGMLFMIAATWPDQIKDDGEHVADGPEGGNKPPTDGTADRNTGYTDLAMHKYWHFIDLPFSTDGTPLIPPDTPNAKTQITTFRKVLASADASDQLRSYDLVWLLHLVGDVHQPLHDTARFSKQSPRGDAGGNFVTVCNPQCGTKLHAFWDGLLGSDPDLWSVIKIGQGLPAPNPQLAGNTNVDQWINESFSLAKSTVYQPPIGGGSGPFVISSTYRTNAVRLARERVALAGARLARILNTELK